MNVIKVLEDLETSVSAYEKTTGRLRIVEHIIYDELTVDIYNEYADKTMSTASRQHYFELAVLRNRVNALTILIEHDPNAWSEIYAGIATMAILLGKKASVECMAKYIKLDADYPGTKSFTWIDLICDHMPDLGAQLMDMYNVKRKRDLIVANLKPGNIHVADKTI